MPIQSPADYSSIPEALSPSTPDAFTGAQLPTIFLSQDASSMDSSAPSTVTDTGPAEKVTRPRNAFMLFRSNFCKERITAGVERDHRHISRIVGHYWHMLSDLEKEKWKMLAEREKLEHQRKYPGWKFRPSPREKKPLKRKVKRNGPADLARSKALAELVRQGKSGADLESAWLESSRETPLSPDMGSSDSNSSGSPDGGYDSLLDSPAGYSTPLVSCEQQQVSVSYSLSQTVADIVLVQADYSTYQYSTEASTSNNNNANNVYSSSSSSSFEYYSPNADYSWMPAEYYGAHALGQYVQEPGFDSHGMLLSHDSDRSFGCYEYESPGFQT